MPGSDEVGRKLNFLNLKKPVSCEDVITIGKGKLVWFKDYIAQEEAEKENCPSITKAKEILDANVEQAFVKINAEKEVSWIDWKDGGGHTVYNQPRCLGSAVLQQYEDGFFTI